MRWVKRGILSVLILMIVGFFHYSLPSRDIVRVVGTDVKRMDIGNDSWFWAESDSGTVASTNRDVRYIEAVWPNSDKPRVYRNEDTNWSWPPYFKFDSGDLSAQAKSLASTKADPEWVVVTHYGWRLKWLSMFPNATKLRPIDDPDTRLIPWFNIVFLSFLAFVALWIWFRVRRWKEARVDPVLDSVGDTADEWRDDARGLGARLRGRFTKKTRS